MTRPESALGLAIRRARERKHWTQERLAAAIDVSARSISNWEQGRRVPRNRIGALEEVLGVSFDEPEPELVPRDEWESRVADDPALPDSVKRALIGDYRAARSAYEEHRRSAAQATPRVS